MYIIYILTNNIYFFNNLLTLIVFLKNYNNTQQSLTPNNPKKRWNNEILKKIQIDT
ncbi:hypothetical protein HNP72_002064 [Sphingobacterium soli]|nr:hypothetical protein [Sphingobacterium soli]